jgi:hypothetical protein
LELNRGNWEELQKEQDPWLLLVLILEWFEHLKEPVLPESVIPAVLTYEVDHSDHTAEAILTRFVVVLSLWPF